MLYKEGTLIFVMRRDFGYPQVLLGKKKNSKFGNGTMNACGGTLEKDELKEDCAIRELREETGLIAEKKDLIYIGEINFFTNGVLDFKAYLFKLYSFYGKPIDTKTMFDHRWYKEIEIPINYMMEGDKHWFYRAFNAETEKLYADVYYRQRGQGFIEIKFKKTP